MNFVDPIYDKEQITEMKKSLIKQLNGHRNLLLFELGLATAFRIGDLLELRVKDVKTGVIRRKTNKRKDLKEFRLNDRVKRLVDSHIEFMDDEELLFPIDRSNAYRILRRAADEVGIKNFGTHSVRKTKAFHFYCDNGKDIRLVMQLLGHEKEDYCLRYIGYEKAQVSELARAHDL